MKPSNISVIYQNQLFVDGLECIFHLEKINLKKREISITNDIGQGNFFSSDLTIIEFNWPYPNIEKIIEKINGSMTEKLKLLILTNIVKKNIYKLIRANLIQGIILKSSNKEELLFGIEQIHEGLTYFSSRLATKFLNKNEHKEINISKREKQVLLLLAKMKTTEKIANELSISKSTVKTHRRNLMRKFNTKNILCLLRFACRESIINADNDFCKCCYRFAE